MSKLIGLTGKARSGKDTFASMVDNYLRGQSGVPIMRQYALASPIKNVINSLFGWDERHSDGYLKEVEVGVLNPTREEFRATLNHFLDISNVELSKMETSFHEHLLYRDSYKSEASHTRISPRRAYQLFGTEVGRGVRDTIWLDQAQVLVDNGENLIITDIRFENEAEWLRRQDGVLLHISRPSIEGVASHESEDGVKFMKGDLGISNEGNLEALQSKAETIKILL